MSMERLVGGKTGKVDFSHVRLIILMSEEICEPSAGVESFLDKLDN